MLVGKTSGPLLVSVVSNRSLSSVSGLNLIGPAVKLLLQKHNLSPNDVRPTGPKNNILKSDVLSLLKGDKRPSKESQKSEPIASKPIKQAGSKKTGSYVDIPLSNMRATIAKRLTESKKSIPHSYAMINITANSLLKLRKIYAKEGIKVSVNDFIIKAVALALKAVPEINVQWKNEAVVRIPTIDVSVAVATQNGLITPIVFGADRLQLEGISNTVRELSNKARENKLKPQEFQGGTFTISNLGMYGITNFTAIINPPQTAILAVGGLSSSIDENLQPINQFAITLCYDNRAIMETDAQRFLTYVQGLISSPETMILGMQPLSVIDLDSL